MAGLTDKQRKFCDEYLVDLNATQAAIRAGYSKKTANVIGHENLTKPYIREYIDKRLAEKEERLVAKQDEVIKYLTAVLRREEKEAIIIPVQNKTEKWVKDEETGKLKKQTITETTPAIVEVPAKLSDANKAAEMLGRYYGLWSAKAELDLREQEARIAKLKAETARIKGEDTDEDMQDDGFMEALRGTVAEVWQDE